MSKNNRGIVWGLSALAVVASASAYLVGRARAAGVPTVQPLTYSGTLTDTGGTPLTGSKNIQVQVWDMASAGTIVCTTGSSAQTLAAGGFSVVLPDACVAAVHANTELWVEVLVDGASTGRSKLGAVPYALEADTASKAAGALNTRIAGLEAGGSAAHDVGGAPMRICSGSTPVGSTAWQVYGGTQIFVTIDTTGCHFANRPIYHPVLAGISSHWTTSGGSNPYTTAGTEKTQFQVYINNGAGGIMPDIANDASHLWHIEWIAIGN